MNKKQIALVLRIVGIIMLLAGVIAHIYGLNKEEEQSLFKITGMLMVLFGAVLFTFSAKLIKEVRNDKH